MSLPEGQDWAGYQTAAPSTAGLAFVFVKATEGTSYVNPRHDSQVGKVRTDGLVVGHYHFQRPGSGVAQAAYFLRHASPRPGDVLVCDWEDAGVSDDDKDAFLRAVKAAQPQLRAVLYCNRDFWLHRDHTSYCADGLWIADPSAPKGQPRVDHPWLFHQYGSPGGLDRNVANFPTAAALRAWAAGTTITPQQEDGMADWKTPLTIKAGPWSEKDYTAPADFWLMLANIKAGRAQAAAEEALAQARANGTTLTTLSGKVGAATLTDAQVTAVADRLAANPAFVTALAGAIGKDLAARMQS